jgi:uncharacterized protein
MEYSKETFIALVGASNNPEKYGYKIFKDLLAFGYDIVGVNPKGEDILDQKIYQSLSEISKKPGLVIIVVPPSVGVSILKECVELGLNNVWMQPGAESSEAIEYAATKGLNLEVNKCFMLKQGIW